MAERWAVATGNWSSPSTWNGGTLPAIDDDVYANGFTVTVDSNRAALTVRTTAGTTAVAGGGFTLANGVTLTLTGPGGNAIAGSSNCVSFSGTGANSATLIGNPIGSATTASRYGAVNTSTGTLNITGNPTGSSTSNSIGCINSSTGTINVIGNPTGSTGANSHGVTNSSVGVINVTGTPVPGVGSGANGIRNNSVGTINLVGNATGGSVNAAVFYLGGSGSITGTVTGGSASAATGVTNAGAGTVTVSGDAVGGSNATAYGASNTGTGTLTVAGTAISATAPGVNGAATATLTSIGSARMGTDKIFPYEGKVVFANLATATLGVRNSAGTLVELSAGGVKNVFSPPSVFGAS